MATHVDLTPPSDPTPRVHPTPRETLGTTTPPKPKDLPTGTLGRALTSTIPAVAAAAIVAVTLGGPPDSGMDVLRAAVVGAAALLAVFAFRAEMRRNGKGSRGPTHATGAPLDVRVRYSDLVDHVEREHATAARQADAAALPGP